MTDTLVLCGSSQSFNLFVELVPFQFSLSFGPITCLEGISKKLA